LVKQALESPELAANVNAAVVEDFGREWDSFDQSGLSDAERARQFDAYFAVFPWDRLTPTSVGFDAGCGTGRWATLVAPRVGHLHCVDPSRAIEVARRSLRDSANCSFHRATIDAMPFADASMDFGYSLGVLHHMPDTQQGLIDCARKLKTGAPLLVYLYYAFDNQPAWFRAIWRTSDLGRRIVSRLPYPLKLAVSQLIAVLVYWPLARFARLLERLGVSVHSWPLSTYRDRSFYSMRTDALDRFGTKLEHRFSQKQILTMMENAGLERVRFSPNVPFWCAVGFKK
jgi:ubiquinone/menaquinone biosynthesis C-methylase UbiE